MIITTDRVEDLIASSHNPRLFVELYQFINEQLGGEGLLFKTEPSSMTIIGYYLTPYKTSNYDGQYPLISIAPQKNNISVYVMVVVDGEYLVTKYADQFGKSNCGKSCIRIKSMNDAKYTALASLLEEAMLSFENK